MSQLRISSIYFLMVVIASSCSRSSVKLFSKKAIKETGIDSTLIRNEDFSINYTEHSIGNIITLKYLGSGGYYIANSHAAILIDPFFSPTKVFSLTLTKISTQTENVENGLSDIKTEVYNHVEAVFNTHSHYDHLMDVPYVFNHYMDTLKPTTKIYGSTSLQAIVSTVVDTLHVENIEEYRGSVDTPGQWLYVNDGQIRVLPLKSDHAPHYNKGIAISLYGGEAEPIKKYKSDTSQTRVTDWREGQSFAYLIDFMENGRPAFRIYLLTSACSPPNGFVYADVLSEHPVNLAILGAASFANVENYPGGIIEHLNPQKILIAHWEDLFKSYLHKPERLIRATNFKELIPDIDAIYPWKVDGEQQFYMPAPGVFVELKY